MTQETREQFKKLHEKAKIFTAKTICRNVDITYPRALKLCNGRFCYLSYSEIVSLNNFFNEVITELEKWLKKNWKYYTTTLKVFTKEVN